MTRLPATLLLLTTALPAVAQDRPSNAATDTGTGTVVCYRSDALTVRMCYRLRANASDPDWLAFEFINQTDEPLVLAGFSYWLNERQVHGIDTGELAGPGGLGQGHHLDLFGQQPPIALAPGTTRVTGQLRDQAAMLLGSPQPEGWRVTAKVTVSVALLDDSLPAPTSPGNAFAFEWHRPDATGLARMRTQLEQLLRNDKSTLATCTTASMLLATPGVGDRMELDLLLTSRPDERHACHYWHVVLRHLDAQHPADPVVIAWVLRQLQADDPHIVEDLTVLAHVWHPSFLPELTRLHERGDPRVLWLLQQRGTPHKAYAAVARRLSRPLLERLPPRDAVTLDADTERRHVARLLRSLGRTGDVDCIERLTPWLGCPLPLSANTEMSLGFDPRIDCHRICDAALEALLRLIGDEGRRGVEAARVAQAARAKGEVVEPAANNRRRRITIIVPRDFPTLDRVQDDQIAALKQYLATGRALPK